MNGGEGVFSSENWTSFNIMELWKSLYGKDANVNVNGPWTWRRKETGKSMENVVSIYHSLVRTVGPDSIRSRMVPARKKGRGPSFRSSRQARDVQSLSMTGFLALLVDDVRSPTTWTRTMPWDPWSISSASDSGRSMGGRETFRGVLPAGKCTENA